MQYFCVIYLYKSPGGLLICSYRVNWLWVEVVGRASYWFVTSGVSVRRSSYMGLCSLACRSLISSLLWWSDCMNICSYGSRRDGLLTCFRSVIVSLIFPYSCLQSHKTWNRITKKWHIQNYMQDLPQIICGTN